MITTLKRGPRTYSITGEVRGEHTVIEAVFDDHNRDCTLRANNDEKFRAAVCAALRQHQAGGGWTIERILAKLETNDILVERALLVVYANQTADEQSAQTTVHQNGQGFNGLDAEILSSFAEWVIKGKDRGIPEGKRLSPKQRDLARKKLRKYGRQLVHAAEAGPHA